MALWMLLLLAPGQVVESDDFPKALQQKAVAASVRIVNRSARLEGSGVLIGRKDGSVYILTAAHFLNRPGRLEISTFTADSYPQPAKVYDKVEVVARTRDVRDLALIRLSADALPPGGLPLCPLRFVPQKGEFESLSVGCGAARAPVCIIEKVREARSIRRQGSTQPGLFWEVAGEQTPGRSGGPLIDRQGRVLGIASGASGGKGYYCHAAEIHRWLKASGYAFLLPDEAKAPEK